MITKYAIIRTETLVSFDDNGEDDIVEQALEAFDLGSTEGEPEVQFLMETDKDGLRLKEKKY